MDSEQERQNRASHKNITLIGEGELAYCKDCKGAEIELWEQSCEERKRANNPALDNK